MTTAIVNRTQLREQHVVDIIAKVMDVMYDKNEFTFNAIGQTVKISKEEFDDKVLYTVDNQN